MLRPGDDERVAGVLRYAAKPGQSIGIADASERVRELAFQAYASTYSELRERYGISDDDNDVYDAICVIAAARVEAGWEP